jgi:hypothetical protein
MMEERPRLKVKLSSRDKLFEAAGWLILAALWVLVGMHYSGLPDVIPVHFDLSGHADGFGSKVMLLSLPAVATLLFLGMTVLNRFPHVFNYPVPITETNARAQYTLATRMIRYYKCSIVFIFGLIAFKTIQLAHGHADRLGIWVLPLILALVFIPLIYFIAKASRTER